MQPTKEGEQVKPIKVIEYGPLTQLPHSFANSARDILWEEVEYTRVVSKFSRDLARKYVNGYASIPETISPPERIIRFTFFSLVAIPLTNQLAHVLYATNGNINGKVVLDLGCGSTNDGETMDLELYKPWLCRALAELGASPIGVDIGNLVEEKFETHPGVNLLEPESLDFLPDNSVDIVHSRALFTSPRLYEESKKSRSFTA